MSKDIIRVLAVGDVCSPSGCDFLIKRLPMLKRKYNIDLTIVNGENSAEGNGILPSCAQDIFSAGADVITGGNHTLRRKEFHPYLDENPFALRPHNYKDVEFGSGYTVIDLGFARAAVINLSGLVYLDDKGIENPFLCADTLLERATKEGIKIIIVDFHAEATSEKRAMGFYLDGKVSALFGTHTHVQTSDAQILENGTGYITDLGMTGVKDSVLGVKKEIIINRLRDKDMSKFIFAEGECTLNGCVFEIDRNTGKTLTIKLINEE